jgi:HEAT repeat protein
MVRRAGNGQGDNEMTKHFKAVMHIAIAAALLARPLYSSQAPTARAWAILEQGVTDKSAGKRATAVHALRLLPDSPRAQKMAENALADSDPKVRSAAARVAGLTRDVSAVAKLRAALNDKAPAVVLAAAHSLFLLGHPEEAWEIDYEVLTGERKGADGFVASQVSELKDSKTVAMMGVEAGVGFAPFGGPVYEVFKRASKDDTSPVRAAAVKELFNDHDSKIDAALTKASSDKKWPVRAAAVYAIAKRDDSVLLNVVTSALDDKNDVVRYDAAAAVLRLSGGKAADQALNGRHSGTENF